MERAREILRRVVRRAPAARKAFRDSGHGCRAIPPSSTSASSSRACGWIRERDRFNLGWRDQAARHGRGRPGRHGRWLQALGAGRRQRRDSPRNPQACQPRGGDALADGDDRPAREERILLRAPWFRLHEPPIAFPLVGGPKALARLRCRDLPRVGGLLTGSYASLRPSSSSSSARSRSLRSRGSSRKGSTSATTDGQSSDSTRFRTTVLQFSSSILAPRQPACSSALCRRSRFGEGRSAAFTRLQRPPRRDRSQWASRLAPERRGPRGPSAPDRTAAPRCGA